MQTSFDPANPSETIKHWVELYADSAYSWALHKTSSKETAEDLVQETFLVAFQTLHKFEGKSNPKTWLFSILNNKINDYYRANLRKQTINGNAFFDKLFDADYHWKLEETPKDWSEESGNLLDDTAFQKTFARCLKKLPHNWFAAVQLKFISEKKSKVICQELGITPTNFWQILHRAKLQLRKCIELNWFKE